MKGVKCVLLDIEGTICPISFVKDTLFPYALKALPKVLEKEWDDETFQSYRDAFPEEVRTSPDALQAHVEDLTKRDVKVAYLKNLQGYLWENGYKTGAYSTPLFPDVEPKLKQWHDIGTRLVIYSSGSVFAQKLLFAHVKPQQQSGRSKRPRSANADGEDGDDDALDPPTKKRASTAEDEVAQRQPSHELDTVADDDTFKKESPGVTAGLDNDSTADAPATDTEDLRYLISEWFDTTNAGPKNEASSYDTIARVLELPPEEVLFLSDNVKEVDAAISAGMHSLLVDRPGNASLTEADKARLTVTESFDEVSLSRQAKPA